MTTRYRILQTDQDGAHIRDINDWTELQYTRKTDDLSALSVTFPARKYKLSDFAETDRIEIWRQVGTGEAYLETGTAWFIRFKRKYFDGGAEFIALGAVPGIELLNRRVVLYVAGSANAGWSGEPEQMLHDIAAYNFGANAAGTGRDIVTPGLMTLGTVTGGLTNITKAAAWRNVLAVMQEICDAVYQNGEFLYFDVTYVPATQAFKFETFQAQRGVDRTAERPFSIETGTLVNPSLEYRYQEYRTFVRALGRGEGAERDYVDVSDSTYISNNNFGRNEATYSQSNSYADDASPTTIANALTAAGNEFLTEHRPKAKFAGQVGETAGNRYGVDWQWGDKVTAWYDSTKFTCWINAISVSMSASGENISANLEIL